MKKALVFLLITAFICLFAACGQTAPAPSPAPTPAPTEAQPDVPAPTPDDEPSTEPTATPSPEPTATPPEETPIPAPVQTSEPAPEPTPTPAPSPEPTPEPTPAPTPEPTPEPTPAPEPYSLQTAATVLTLRGSALDREWYFTLSELQSLGGTFSGDYFSLGKDPVELTNAFTGIRVSYLLEQVAGVQSYKKATFTASDGYAGSWSRGMINSMLINEKDPSASLPMILAWTEDGAPCALRLVMGQQLEGEYNRTNWIRGVAVIEVRAE